MKTGCQTIVITRCNFRGRKSAEGNCDFYETEENWARAQPLCVHYDPHDNECTSHEARRAEQPEK